jgi:hypothetical protein
VYIDEHLGVLGCGTIAGAISGRTSFWKCVAGRI